MVEYGQYPLVLQIQDGLPVGLAESFGNFSSVNLVVSSVSANEYLGLTGSVTIPVPIHDGGTGATTDTDARANLGLTIGTHIQAFDPGLTDIAGLSPGDSTFIVGDGAGWVAETGSTVRTSLGLGTIATVNSPIPVTDGGTGATTNSDARTNLGLTIGTHVQAQNANLNALAGITLTDKKILVGGAGGALSQIDVPTNGTYLKYTTVGGFLWDAGGSVSLPGTQYSVLYENPVGTIASNNTIKIQNGVFSASSASSTTASANTYYVGPPGSDVPITKSGAGDIAVAGNTVYRVGGTDIAVTDGGTGASDAATARTNLGLAIGTNVQQYNANLAAIAALAVTDNNVIVGNGSTWVAESGSTVRASLGLGTIATVNSPIPVTDGGTGQTTANTALNALLPSQSTNNGKYLKTDGTNTIWDTPAGGGAWTSVFKSSDQVVTGITETNDNDLKFNVDAAGTYAFNLNASFADTGYGYTFAFSSAAVVDYNIEYADGVNRTVTIDCASGTTYSTGATPDTGGASPARGFVRIRGAIINSTGGATGFQYKFCSGASTKTASTTRGSFLEYKKL